MALSEFALIQRFFSACGTRRADVALGVGDDCAILCVPPGMELAATLDTLVEGVHFFPSVAAGALGHKSLAVNLSDLAAMGAEPAWVTLALTLPRADARWLQAFSDGFCALARAAGVALVGGDTTRGPLSISVQAQGFVPCGQAWKRAGARPGDGIFVSGTLGDAALALAAANSDLATDDAEFLRQRLEWPQPRNALGIALRGMASSAIDISDGLLADLGHILRASHVGAQVELARLPCSAALAAHLRRSGDWRLPLGGGDDYELCFTVAPEHEAALRAAAERLACPVTRIGHISAHLGLRLRAPDGSDYAVGETGWDHFA